MPEDFDYEAFKVDYESFNQSFCQWKEGYISLNGYEPDFEEIENWFNTNPENPLL